MSGGREKWTIRSKGELGRGFVQIESADTSPDGGLKSFPHDLMTVSRCS